MLSTPGRVVAPTGTPATTDDQPRIHGEADDISAATSELNHSSSEF